jgi:hypothetical protein
MADVRENFPVLEDITSGAGLPLHKCLEGDDIGGNALTALVAKNASDELRYLLVDALTGALKVTMETGEYALLSDSGTNAGNISYQDLATIVLQNEFVYKEIEIILSCFRDCVGQLVFIADVGGTPVETILVDGIRVGAGEYTLAAQLKSLEFTSGATGVQNLVLRAKNLNVTSTMDGTLTTKEVQQ